MICSSFFFFFNDTATTEIYTLSLHDALPISLPARIVGRPAPAGRNRARGRAQAALCPRRRDRLRARRIVKSPSACAARRDRKSTRLNSSHANISYAVFCLKKKKQKHKTDLEP